MLIKNERYGSQKNKMWNWKLSKFLYLSVTSSLWRVHCDTPSQKQLCDKKSPSLLGPLLVLPADNVPSLKPATEEFIEWYGPNKDNGYTFVEKGGSCKPQNCKTRWPKLAIIVPYRDRDKQIKPFMHHIHPILQRQQLDYRIFMVEQSPGGIFNKASLMNVGFLESNRIDSGFTCFVFHDIDLLSEDDRNLYVCPQDNPNEAKHISVAVNIMKYKLPYNQIAGGVIAISKSQMEKINGFSNQFNGWGGEDDDIYARLKNSNITIFREPANISRFTMLPHTKWKVNKDLDEIMKMTKTREYFSVDGLNSLRYDLLNVEENLLYTKLLVKLPPPHKLKKKTWLDIAESSMNRFTDKVIAAATNTIFDVPAKEDDELEGYETTDYENTEEIY